jgi:Asp-tRNA(Asn)/Glu-tRNA(Gln) amidotransferase A subunit family amidase
MIAARKLPDATELRKQLASGSISASSVVSDYLSRLEKHHHRINAATQRFHERALLQARNPRLGPLSGIPISIKETFGIAGEEITVGSLRMPPEDLGQATVVSRLLDAGAIPIARSNVPEFAMTGETTNLRFGRTNNCLNTTRTAGGSSGGEGALVGSGSTVLGVGSDILGSIRIPAAFNGVVGFKPASHAVPKSGTWPDLNGHFVDSLLAIGPITRSVRDARLVYNVIADAALPNPRPVDAVRLIIPQPFQMTIQDMAIDAALAQSRTVLEFAGLRVETHAFDEIAAYYNGLIKLITYSFEKPMRDLLTTADGQKFRKSAEFMRQLAGRPTIDRGLFQMLLTMPLVRAKEREIQAIIAHFETGRRYVRDILRDDGVMLLPALGLLAPPHGAMNRSTLKPGVNGTMTPMTFCNYMDLPAITVPAWCCKDRETGLVPGIMLVCAPGAEGTLLDVAAVLEAGISDL